MNVPRIFAALFLLGSTACLSPQAAPDRKQTPTALFGAAPATVSRISPQFGFVVLEFRSRAMPAPGTCLNVYRNKEHVGIVKISEPVRTRYATADVIEGEVKLGDEAR